MSVMKDKVNLRSYEIFRETEFGQDVLRARLHTLDAIDVVEDSYHVK